MDINTIHNALSLLEQDLNSIKLYAERSLPEGEVLSRDFHEVMEYARMHISYIREALTAE